MYNIILCRLYDSLLRVAGITRLKISWTKSEFIECIFSENRSRNKLVVKIYDQEISQSSHFCYLGSIIGYAT